MERNGKGMVIAVILTVAMIAVGIGNLANIVTGFAAQQDNDIVPQASLPKPVTTDLLPTPQIDGVVWTQKIAGPRVYVGGQFGSSRPFGQPAGTDETPRNHMLAYDLVSGDLINDFAPQFNGAVTATELSTDGRTLYVGGLFTRIGDHKRYRIAAFDAATGQLLQDFRPTIDYRVAAIEATDTAVYFGGKFSSVNGQPRRNLAAVNPDTGELLPWAPEVNGAVTGLAISPSKDRIVAGGNFNALNGAQRIGWAAMDSVTGATKPWLSHPGITNHGQHAAITSVRGDNNAVYATGYSFGRIGLEGTIAADWDTGRLIYANDSLGDSHDVLPMNDVLYSVGHQHDGLAIGGKPDHTEPNYQFAVAHTLGASPADRMTPRNSSFPGLRAPEFLHWMPHFVAGTYTGSNQAGYSLEGDGSYLLIGGEFTHVMYQGQQGLARFATRQVAPNQVGPRDLADVKPMIAHQGAGDVHARFTTAWDPDSRNVEYTLRRDGRDVATTTITDIRWWNKKQASLLDRAPNGTYSYTLQVTDGDGNQWVSPATDVTVTGSNVQEDTIVAEAVVTVDDKTGHFDARKSYATSVITDYAWDFGDGSSGSGEKTSHTYTEYGDYVATLTITDTDGQTATATVPVTARGPNTAPVAVPQVSTSGLTVTVDASQSTDDDGDVTSYAWDFGDGTTLDTNHGKHTYATPGQKVVRLTVVDNLGASHTAQTTITVFAPPADEYAATVRADGARHHWPLDETSGRTAQDIIGGNHFRLQQSTAAGLPAAGALAGADTTGLLFEGKPRAPAVASDRQALPQSFAIELWLKTTTTTGGVIMNAGDARTFSSWRSDREVLMDDAGRLGIRTFPGQEVVAWSDDTYNDGKWHHVVANVGQGGLNLVVDGRQVAQASLGGAERRFGYWRLGGDTIRHLRHLPISSSHFHGTVDEVAVYHRELTPEIITNHIRYSGFVPTHPVLPKAQFTAATDGLTVTVDGSESTTEAGEITNYQWDFGDGTVVEGAKTGHTYAAPGDYPVVLQVTTDTGATGVLTRTVTVATATEPEPEPGPDPEPEPNPEPPATGTVGSDDFTRTVTNGWGDAATGGAYDLTGSHKDFFVTGEHATMALSRPGRTRAAWLPGASGEQLSSQVAFSVPETRSGGGVYVTLVGKKVGSEEYRARVRLFADGSASLVIQTLTGNSLKTIAGKRLPFDVAAGDTVMVAMDVAPGVENQLAATAWLAGSPKPADSTVTAVHANEALQQRGSAGVMGYLSRSADPAPVTIRFDDLLVTSN